MWLINIMSKDISPRVLQKKPNAVTLPFTLHIRLNFQEANLTLYGINCILFA